MNVGSLDTGHHAYVLLPANLPIRHFLPSNSRFTLRVSVSVASIASLLPSTEDNAAHYTGLTSTLETPSKVFNNNPLGQRSERDVQQEDAEKRRVAWDAEADVIPPGEEDAEGEPDLEATQPETLEGRALEGDVPIGIRGAGGVIEPYIPLTPKAAKTPVIIKSMRQDERSINFHSQTSAVVVCPLSITLHNSDQSSHAFMCRLSDNLQRESLHKVYDYHRNQLLLHPLAPTSTKRITSKRPPFHLIVQHEVNHGRSRKLLSRSLISPTLSGLRWMKAWSIL